MQQQLTPPPFPIRPKKVSYGIKVLLMGLQCFILMLGALAVLLITIEREGNNRDVSDKFVSEWGGDVEIQAPCATKGTDSKIAISPSEFKCNIDVDSKSLHRGIYEAEVFDARVSMSGTFNRDSLSAIGDLVCIDLPVPQKEASKLNKLSICGKEYSWEREGSRFYSIIDINDVEGNLIYAIEYDVRGSKEIVVTELGDKSTITIEGVASNPSFSGSLLPDERTIKEDKFKATWNFENRKSSYISAYDNNARVSFLVGVDRYQKVERSLKYAFIIIVLTFATILFTEIILHHPIPLLNYFLIGAALIIFYSLLLSFVEQVSFGYAYLIAAAMTTLLITTYMWKMLKSRKVGLTIGAILTGIYAGCYVMLCLSDYALLMGSLILFSALATIMYVSLKIKTP